MHAYAISFVMTKEILEDDDFDEFGKKHKFSK